jgi:hypothetical protein
MRAGVVYFNTGERCLVRLCVSLKSLRTVYEGPVTLLALESLPPWANTFARELDVEVRHIAGENDVSSRTMKASLWRHVDFDVSLFLDADTFVRRSPSPLFGAIETAEFLVTRFAGWITRGRIMSKRIREWSCLLNDADLSAALAYGPAINTGVFGWRKGAQILSEWERMARAGWQHGCTRRMIDEVACQVLLPRFRHIVVGDEWNTSACFPTGVDPAIIHYHGNRHVGARELTKYWKAGYWNLRQNRRLARYLCIPHGDRGLRDYLRNASQKEVSVVTVVNSAYQEKLKRNWPLWMQMTGLREQQFLIFAVGEPDLTFLDGLSNVAIIPWNQYGDTREACLSAFVFGVAAHVRRPFWMKLDCDVRPVSSRFEWPKYGDATITAHRWGYTRVKGDPGATRHWLNTLDEWWGGEPLFSPGLDVHRRHPHRRFTSFCAIEKTLFTHRLAERCGRRLPVPSQDTTSWYAATRWSEPIRLVNMRRFFRQ